MNGQEHDVRTTLPRYSPLYNTEAHIKIQFILGYMYSMKEFLVARSHTANGSMTVVNQGFHCGEGGYILGV